MLSKDREDLPGYEMELTTSTGWEYLLPTTCNARCPAHTTGDLCIWAGLQWYPKMQPVWKDGDVRAVEYHHFANGDLDRKPKALQCITGISI